MNKGLIRVGVAHHLKYTSYQRCFSSRVKPPTPNISTVACLKVWLNSFKKNRLATLQNELVETMLSEKYNQDVYKHAKKTSLDKDGNFINEIIIELKEKNNKPIKDIVFVHGYGASLGCFARNFQLIDRFKDSKYHYRLHFLDNITFGLSSNPQIKSPLLSNRITRCPDIRLNDTSDQKENIYNKYYKLIDSFEINKEDFVKYQEELKSILIELETFYTSAIENWRVNSNIEKIDFLIGHSYGGYWSSSYALKYPDKLDNLVLLSPVGVERHAHAVTMPLHLLRTNEPIKPTIDPSSYTFLSRLPLLSTKHIFSWYILLPYLPRILKLLGPWGVRKFFNMRFPKLYKVKRVMEKLGGHEVLDKLPNNKSIGTYEESFLIFEYLYNSITNGSNSDIYIKYLLTPSTVSKWPLYDKFVHFYEKPEHHLFNIDLIYGQFDFMNSEAGVKLAEEIRTLTKGKENVEVHYIKEGGHNLYLDNPFDTNSLLAALVKLQEK